MSLSSDSLLEVTNYYLRMFLILSYKPYNLRSSHTKDLFLKVFTPNVYEPFSFPTIAATLHYFYIYIVGKTDDAYKGRNTEQEMNILKKIALKTKAEHYK
jgi:hypothetical protein